MRNNKIGTNNTGEPMLRIAMKPLALLIVIALWGGCSQNSEYTRIDCANRQIMRVYERMELYRRFYVAHMDSLDIEAICEPSVDIYLIPKGGLGCDASR